MGIGISISPNSREREFEDRQYFFQQPDPWIHLQGVTRPRGSGLAIIEARWEGEAIVFKATFNQRI